MCIVDGCVTVCTAAAHMRNHFIKMHGSDSFHDPDVMYKDHLCELGLLDARSLCHHMMAKMSGGSHVTYMCEELDVACFIAYKA